MVFLLFCWFSQSADRQEEGAHQKTNERIYGVGASSPSRDVKAVPEPPELGAEQITRQAVEVSIAKIWFFNWKTPLVDHFSKSKMVKWWALDPALEHHDDDLEKQLSRWSLITF